MTLDVNDIAGDGVHRTRQTIEISWMCSLCLWSLQKLLDPISSRWELLQLLLFLQRVAHSACVSAPVYGRWVNGKIRLQVLRHTWLQWNIVLKRIIAAELGWLPRHTIDCPRRVKHCSNWFELSQHRILRYPCLPYLVIICTYKAWGLVQCQLIIVPILNLHKLLPTSSTRSKHHRNRVWPELLSDCTWPKHLPRLIVGSYHQLAVVELWRQTHQSTRIKSLLPWGSNGSS